MAANFARAGGQRHRHREKTSSSRVQAAPHAVQPPYPAVQRASRRVRIAPDAVRHAPIPAQTVSASVRLAPFGVQRVSDAVHRVRARVQRARRRRNRAPARVHGACHKLSLFYSPGTSTTSQNPTPMNNRELARTNCFDNVAAFGRIEAFA